MVIKARLFHFTHHHRLYLTTHEETHHHRLYLTTLEEWSVDYECRLCKVQISEGSQYYGCVTNGCTYNIHSICASFPRKMVHPFHPHHTLTLRLDKARTYYRRVHFCRRRRRPPPTFENHWDLCDVCRCEIKESFFECSECSFNMHLACAALMPIQGGGKTGLQILKYSMLPRRLLICSNNNISFSPECFGCRLPIITTDRGARVLVVCPELPALMHESCVEFSQDIPKHILHPQHPLILTKMPRSQCNGCGKFSNSFGFLYHCEPCYFDLDLACASLTSTTINKEYRHHHPHPLIECYRKKKKYSLLPLSCSGCTQLFKDEESIYVCLPWKQLLHESCTQSCREIDHHPYHLAHPLSLYDETPHGQMSVMHNCKACTISSSKGDSHFYRCCECNFYLHTKCALPVPPFFTSQKLHQHPLAFLNRKLFYPCNACTLISCNYPVFRCVECNFNLHFHCVPKFDLYSLTLTHSPVNDHNKCDLHSLRLTLTHLPVKNHDDEEEEEDDTFCDACKKYIRLNEPTYYCKECPYVAHVHCVISIEDFPYLARVFASLGDIFDKMKLDTALDVVEDIAGPELQMDA